MLQMHIIWKMIIQLPEIITKNMTILILYQRYQIVSDQNQLILIILSHSLILCNQPDIHLILPYLKQSKLTMIKISQRQSVYINNYNRILNRGLTRHLLKYCFNGSELTVILTRTDLKRPTQVLYFFGDLSLVDLLFFQSKFYLL